MMTNKTRGLATFGAAAVALMASGLAGQAQDRYERLPVLHEGNWSVDLVHDSQDGGLWCEGTTTNRAGQTLDITGYDSGPMVAYVFDPDWNIAERAIEFQIDIDYSRWEIEGLGESNWVSFVLGESNESVRFLTELQAGKAVAVKNVDGRSLATFTLDGSRVAIDGLMQCWSRILEETGETTDPFLSASDPFH